MSELRAGTAAFCSAVTLLQSCGVLRHFRKPRRDRHPLLPPQKYRPDLGRDRIAAYNDTTHSAASRCYLPESTDPTLVGIE